MPSGGHFQPQPFSGSAKSCIAFNKINPIQKNKNPTQPVTCKDSNAYSSAVQHISQPVSSPGEYCARTVLWKSVVLHLLLQDLFKCFQTML